MNPTQRKPNNYRLHALILAAAAIGLTIYNMDADPSQRKRSVMLYFIEESLEAPKLTVPQKQILTQVRMLEPPDLSGMSEDSFYGLPKPNEMLERWLANYFNVLNDLKPFKTQPGRRIEILTVWGILLPYELKKNGKEPVWADMQILSSETLQDSLITWSVPVLEKVWQDQTEEDRDLLRQTMFDAADFVREVDIEKEKAHMADPGVHSFVRVDANGNRRKHAKLEAFILRRICHGDITRERFIVLLDRVISIVEQWDKSLEPAPDGNTALTKS